MASRDARLRVVREGRIDRRQFAFQVFACLLLVSTVAARRIAVLDWSVSALSRPLAVFVLLVSGSRSQGAIFGDETGITGSVIVVIAAVCAFQHDAPVLGPTLCSLAGALQWATSSRSCVVEVDRQRLRQQPCPRVAGLLVSSIVEPDRPSVAAVLLGAVVVYWVLNNFIVAALAMSSTQGRPAVHSGRRSHSLRNSDDLLCVVGGAVRPPRARGWTLGGRCRARGRPGLGRSARDRTAAPLHGAHAASRSDGALHPGCVDLRRRCCRVPGR